MAAALGGTQSLHTNGMDEAFAIPTEEAMRIALAGYVIPFIAVYSPALMLQPGDPMAAEIGFYGAVAYATVKALDDPTVRTAIEVGLNVPTPAESIETFTAFVRQENDKAREIVKLTGIKGE